MLDAPITGGHFLGDYMGLTVAGRLVHPVFGIAEEVDRGPASTRAGSGSRAREDRGAALMHRY
jgi:hypothetical protein